MLRSVVLLVCCGLLLLNFILYHSAKPCLPSSVYGRREREGEGEGQVGELLPGGVLWNHFTKKRAFKKNAILKKNCC